MHIDICVYTYTHTSGCVGSLAPGGLTYGKHALDRGGGVRVHHQIGRREQPEQQREDGLVGLARELAAEDGDELDGIGDEDGVRRRGRDGGVEFGGHVLVVEVV